MLIKPAEYMTPDPRFKSWVKLLTSKSSIDISKDGGFALVAPVLPFDASYTLLPNQFLLMAAQHGTRSKQQYNHVLLHLDDTGRLNEIDKEDLLSAYVDADESDSDNEYYYAVAQYCTECFEDSSHQVNPETVDVNAVGLTQIKTRVLIDELESRIASDDCDIVSYLAGMIENLNDSQLIEFVVNRGYAIVNKNGEEDNTDPFE